VRKLTLKWVAIIVLVTVIVAVPLGAGCISKSAVAPPTVQEEEAPPPPTVPEEEAPPSPAVPEEEAQGSEGETYVELSFEAGSPVSAFSEGDIDYLGIDCSGGDEEIAGCIRKWQEDNMIYASPDKGYDDAPDPMHWNYFLPGIWSSKDIIYEHTDNGKVYGICHDFAIVYCSIANYYDLECRVINTKSRPCEQAGGEPQSGMLQEEYDRNKAKLDENGLDYSYAAVNAVAEGTPTHYWAEVYLNGEWVAEDGSQKATGGSTKTEFIATNDFEVTDWLSRDKTELLESYSYEGITDDLGQSGRAANIDDLMQGLAFAPYFDEAEGARDFVRAGDAITETDLSEAMEDKEAYESCSGKKLYLVCYFACDGDELEGAEWIERYELLSGGELDLDCYNSCLGD